jgi:FtsP/CotA-like multicopper oxidase with cupredoxin domain
VTLPSGRTIDGWTFGSLPGPEIRVQQGDLVEVTLVNADIADGVTVHWHGYPVPNGEDGVAGVTQDAGLPGGSFVYRFVAKDAGTYWYHGHQVSSEAVSRGLFGALIVEPKDAASGDTGLGETDLTVAVHTIDGITTVRGTDLVDTHRVAPGDHAQLRMINTDSVPHRISVTGAGFSVLSRWTERI